MKEDVMKPTALPILLSGMCLLSGCTATIPFISEVQSVTICQSDIKPGHLAWPKAFLDNEGNLCVIFQQITGDLTCESSHDFHQHPENYQIKLICMQAAPGSSEFHKLWEKICVSASSFFIPAPTPAPDGKMLAVSLPAILPQSAGLPPGSAIILESDDCGRNFTLRSVITLPGTEIWPNDIKYIGSRLYMASYDGKGACHIFYSDDDGYTWSEPLEIVKSHDNMSFHEPSFCELSDGDLLVVMRTHRMDIPRHNGINYHFARISKDDRGKLYMICEETPLTANYIFDADGKISPSPVRDSGFGFRGRPYIQKISNGTIIMVAPGSFIAISKDDGNSWHSGLWNMGISKVTITDRSGTKPYNWNAETMILELPDGRIFYSWFLGSDFPFPPPCDMYIGGTFFRLNESK